ncbi:MAG: glucoamylase family protein [Pseudorhodobacter sp.]|nr:glucoamylase family protein [Pseudorhodobacter sp.]
MPGFLHRVRYSVGLAGTDGALWADTAAIRAELFGVERLEHHAESLAAAQIVADRAGAGKIPGQRRVRVPSLTGRMKDNVAVLLSAYRASGRALDLGHGVSPAAEWLLDNFHLVEQQLRQIEADLPPGYYRQLPKLITSPFAGYPRVFGLAWAYVAHTDSLVDATVLCRFISAYQRVQSLLIGELWAVAISLRMVLLENMRRLAGQIVEAQQLRITADSIADQLLGAPNQSAAQLHVVLARYEAQPLPEVLAAQLAKRLRGYDPKTTPLRDWLEDRLQRQGSSMDAVVRHAFLRQAATNVTMRNIIASLRLISELDWAEIFEAVSLVDARLRAGSDFAAMDFQTRNSYRTAIEQLSRGSNRSELEITDCALEMARDGRADGGATADPGYYLIAGGRRGLEQRFGFVVPWRLRLSRAARGLGIGGYVGAIAATTTGVLAMGLWASGADGLALLALAGLAAVPSAEAATALINLAVTRAVAPQLLPGLDLASGIPVHLKTLVAVPVLLSDADDLAEQIERLEVHFLASGGEALHYAMLSDGPDAASETTPLDAPLIAAAVAEIARLNAAYPSDTGDRFLLLHRRRLWNAGESCWMGWERKRGKLCELNRLLRGATNTTFLHINGRPPTVPADIRYVITLDADTRLPRETVHRMVGKMAHPLNWPQLDATGTRVIGGYGILQPRVTPALPLGRAGSRFQQIYSSPGGIDPYAAAVSDVYQDLFGEGSFTGKGIYDVDAFMAALAGRVPPDTMLSHDLFEGIFARAGLATDIEVVEDFPPRYDVAAMRQHRWVRGDWQLLPWLFGARRQEGGGVPAIGRWKMFDNLKRSALAPLTLAALSAGWMLPLPEALIWSGFILGMLTLPELLLLPFALLPGRAGVTARSHFAALAADVRGAASRILLNIVFLADHGWRMLDAISRTLVRLNISRRHLLEWTTAAQTGGRPRPGILGHYRAMFGGVAFGLLVCELPVIVNPEVWPLVAGFAALWLAAPAVAQRISQPVTARQAGILSPDDVQALRQIARSSWRYFETFVSADTGHLPPDNFQEDPMAVVAHRTSPTNMGLYLLSVVAARDMGWCGQRAALTLLEQTLQRMQTLPRHRGHFYNWYDIRELQVLSPPYVSSVDSGNLAGHLIVVANACRAWQGDTLAPAELRRGIADAALLARAALAGLDAGAQAPLAATLAAVLAQLASAPDAVLPDFAALVPLAEQATAQAEAVANPGSDLRFWISALARSLAEHAADQQSFDDMGPRLEAAANLAHGLAMAMDFAFLVDPEKKLLAIGFNVESNSLDASCYDLLASESRLASLFSIAKGDVETQHWFRLGRGATPIGAAAALISWSGSMFEYLMPALVMRAPVGSVLEQTNRLIVARQQAYGRVLGLPWGISESAYNARDLELTYQYSDFGVPGLGLKRGLGGNRVVAPYATGLATMVDPVAARANFARLAALGAKGRYGFYEAIDFTTRRVPAGSSHVIVRSYMAHHQAMTITAITNTLQNGHLRSYFHAEPMIKAAELLLQERVARDAVSVHPHAEEVHVSTDDAKDTPIVRHCPCPGAMQPTAHLLSNGRYSVMLTPTGSGYSHWRNMAITRWRADATQDDQGSYILARDVQSGAIWSASFQPTRADASHHKAMFCEHHVAFTHSQRRLTTATEVVVSAEDDAEARRVSLVNSGRRDREVELTSYCELVLAPAAADLSHPAFSKLFVVTDYLPELGVIIATRRRRSPSEPEIWAAHLAVVEAEETAPMQIETDRSRFIGRGRSIDQPLALDDVPLSGSTGTVLDPIFAIRRRLRVPAGGSAKVTFWTLVAQTSDALLDLVDRHRDPSAFERAATLAWTRAQVQLRHLSISNAEAANYQRLAGMILQSDARLRPPSAVIEAGAGPQSGVWPYAISGDLPIVLLCIDDVEDADVVRQALAAHEYWRSKQLAVDLVILNERAASYVQDLQIAIETAVRTVQSRPRTAGTILPHGAVYVLRADLMTAEARALLTAAARVVLVANRGPIGQQLDTLLEADPDAMIMPKPAANLAAAPPFPDPDHATTDLEFFNGIGGFAKDGREYVTHLSNGQTTPAPWINVIANPGFGFQVSAEGSGFTWAENSRENQITAWSNDPVTDAPGEALYIRDDDSGAVWTPTALPIRGPGRYTARHGFGYSRFAHDEQGIAAEMVQFVPLDDPVKITRLTLHNQSNRPRRLSITAYAEWSLGTSRSATSAFVTTEIDAATGAMLARNPWNTAFGGRVAFADLQLADPVAAKDAKPGHSADRSEFLGFGGSLAAPAGLRGATALSGRTGAALDPCAALQQRLHLAPGASIELVVLLGQADSTEAARDLIGKTRDADLDTVLAGINRHWESVLNAVQVRTPDRAMDIMLNGWLLYQTLACRIWARAGFYQASGAYGFRDQLQDGMALCFTQPQLTREHLLRAAARQFPQGDVQHWWLPHSGQGVRSRISDDRVWLGYGVAQYVQATGDAAILDEVVPFIDGPALLPGAHDDFFQPMPAAESASLFEHCARGLDQCISLTGANGMPLIGTGDWNDGMNRVGAGGAGTSVWLGWLLIATIEQMAPLADSRDPERAARWRSHAASVRVAIERDGWDGAWYRRGTFDDGTLLGSAESEDCRIDSIAQSWAVLSGAGEHGRVRTAMASLERHLIRREPGPGMALLFTPPFDRTDLDPGYIKGYPPGLRENGGQYSHAAMWAVLAHARLGDGDAAGRLFALLNPINHALTPADADRYKLEPYVIAADVYSTAPHAGRGGWSWYTGSAGWMYRAGIEGILGLSQRGDTLRLDPCFPKAWPRVAATVEHGAALYDIVVENPGRTGRGIASAVLDGRDMAHKSGPLILPLAAGTYRLNVTLAAADGGHADHPKP